MKFFQNLLMAGVLILYSTGLAGAEAQGMRSMIDPTGRTVQVPRSPRRVVSLAPSVTETVFALKRGNRLVGVTRFCNYPPEAQKLPNVGTYVHLDVERIVALQPDVCIAVKDGNPLAVVEQLQAMGIAVFAVNPMDLETVMQSVLAIGDLLQATETAQTLVADMRQRIARVEARVAGARTRPRVFFQIGISPIVSVGDHTFIHTLIGLAGGVNVAAGDNPYPRFSVEQVIGAAPEVIVISSMAREAVFERVKADWMQWPVIPAVRDQRIFIAPPDLFDRPSPRLVEALELLAGYIHPELSEARP
ncbi:MAG: cobalamin-binding protein [Desulfobacteraceae bacterium]|nr:cobalamin-binding protein [Desulfobacteraceae bacterium]